MFIPLHDRNALEHIRRPYVTYALVATNLLVWAFTAILPVDTIYAIDAGLGFIPSISMGNKILDPSLVIVPDGWTVITYAFLHQDFWHLASNMLFLWIFGDNIEDAMGHFRYLAFYLLCATAGALFHGLVTFDPDVPLIGASGAIAGVISAYLILHPKVRLWVLVLFRFPLPLPAAIPLLFWVLQQFYFLVVDTEGTVSWGAHAGGIIAGALLVLVMRRRGVPLFDRPLQTTASIVHADGSAPEKPPPLKWGRE
ncbi:rhomboid family intramembrane serine protease [Rhizobium sp. L1K21]|uniref:rhomboid family intramembrane serine protease n=1 Tax=Rhizobium sp. L1K21 TaxID=2954933 RepID=UPI002093E7E0|nr:rhomboid family intramembrane serine protease [Rhizobium sp. L1K21]MCO6188181.1 rhomboid family intramembrane serine protease [Rhizobium sp. L1K21]